MESNSIISTGGVCQSFIPQQWRKTKCKLCFCDIMEHRKNLIIQESKDLNRSNRDLEEASAKIASEILADSGDMIDLPTTKDVSEDIEPCYSPRSNYTTESSKGSSDRLDYDDTNEEDASSTKFDSNDNMKYDDDESSVRKSIIKRKEMLPSPFSYDQQDSIDIEEGCNSPRTIKRRARSYNKRDSNLLQFSAMIRSSNSSLCSLTSEYTDGYSDYDYDVRSITDDTDDYTEVNDVIDELENIKPELRARVQNERRMSRSKILDLERELEGQHDLYRANEAVKERQILAYQREIEGLKLELSSVKAHEHILALKSRLELEGKAARINDLEMQVKSLQDEIQRLSCPLEDIMETQQYALNKNLDLAEKRNISLEEENRNLQEKLSLGEDLRRNDRELLEFLRKQLSSLESDLVSARENNRLLEDNLKMMEGTRVDYVKEQEKCAKLSKELESLRQKVKRRDRHIEDLEDDNVKLQKLKTALESQLSKKDFQMKKMERRVSELQSKVTKCNKEIADLTGEKKTFEQVQKLTHLKLKDLQGSCEEGSEVENGKNIFIHTLEERLRYSESRVKELQLENNIFIKDIGEVYNNFSNAEKEVEEYKEKCKELEIKCNKMEEERQHMDKKNQWLQRKLHKSEQEKKRALHRQNDAELKLIQCQEQCVVTSDISVSNMESAVDETDTRMLKLKLQSTEAKLSMIEGNKSYLETKVKSLERKVREKESEIQRLLDSMERDSGAPSQDYDRFDSLERENIMLQSKLDEMALENMEQKQLVNQLEENNTHLEVTIKNMNEKLETCNMRLRELENANHKLGREAFRRSQSFNSNQDELITELQSLNKSLQEKVKKFGSLEELVEQLDIEVKNEKGNVQWYANENEKLKIKIMKISQNVQSLDRSKREFESTIQHLQETNKELDAEVKRLEQKLEIYGDLFGKDSKLSSSLRRRSYQSDEERDEEQMIEKALAPLMEEIKEKDSQIKSLHEAMEERNMMINTLTAEIDLLEANLAAMVTEKIKNMHFSGDSSGENEHSENEITTDNLLFSTESGRKLSDGEEDKDEDILPGNNVIRKMSSVEQSGHISPELDIEIKKEYTIKSNESSEWVSKEVCDNSPDLFPEDQELTVTTDVFYNILHNHQKSLEKKDLAYYRSVIDGGDSPTENKFYKTIETALLDQYCEDKIDCTSPLPSLSSASNNSVTTSEKANVERGKVFVEDMYDKLAELEGIVNIKYKSPHGSPKQRDFKYRHSNESVIEDNSNIGNDKAGKECDKEGNKEDYEEGDEDDDDRDFDKTISSLNNDELIADETGVANPSLRNKAIDNLGIDLSGLDDLLDEVNRRGIGQQEKVAQYKKEVRQRRSLPATSSSFRVRVPSIRTTKRRIVRLGELNRSESFDATVWKRGSYSGSWNIRSSSSLEPDSLNGGGNSASSTSSIASSGSQTSVIYIPFIENDGKSSENSTDNGGGIDTNNSNAPFQRPDMDAHKLLNSSSQNIDNSNS